MELIEAALIRGEKCQTTEKEERRRHVTTDAELEAACVVDRLIVCIKQVEWIYR